MEIKETSKEKSNLQNLLSKTIVCCEGDQKHQRTKSGFHISTPLEPQVLLFLNHRMEKKHSPTLLRLEASNNPIIYMRRNYRISIVKKQNNYFCGNWITTHTFHSLLGRAQSWKKMNFQKVMNTGKSVSSNDYSLSCHSPVTCCYTQVGSSQRQIWSATRCQSDYTLTIASYKQEPKSAAVKVNGKTLSDFTRRRIWSIGLRIYSQVTNVPF